MGCDIDNSYIDEELVEAFNQFHPNENGRIELENIIGTLGKMGESVSEDEINELLVRANLERGQSIDFEQFK